MLGYLTTYLDSPGTACHNRPMPGQYSSWLFPICWSPWQCSRAHDPLQGLPPSYSPAIDSSPSLMPWVSALSLLLSPFGYILGLSLETVALITLDWLLCSPLAYIHLCLLPCLGLVTRAPTGPGFCTVAKINDNNQYKSRTRLEGQRGKSLLWLFIHLGECLETCFWWQKLRIQREPEPKSKVFLYLFSPEFDTS